MSKKFLKIKNLDKTRDIPHKGSKYAAGYDLCANIPRTLDEKYDGEHRLMILPHTTVKIKTGIAAELPTETFGAIVARSGIATKRGLRPANAIGIVDSDYRGELIVALHNDTDEVQYIEDGERIAQFIVIPYVMFDDIQEVEELSETERGEGGFGSTGTK